MLTSREGGTCWIEGMEEDRGRIFLICKLWTQEMCYPQCNFVELMLQYHKLPLLSHHTVGKALPALAPGLAVMLDLADRSRGKLDIIRGMKRRLCGPLSQIPAGAGGTKPGQMRVVRKTATLAQLSSPGTASPHPAVR